MFFVALLLEEVLNWTRQPGTRSARHTVLRRGVRLSAAAPRQSAEQVPLMTLSKQARAFGVGVLLATQNPVDLDYKALSNAGTWFVGKLQTEHDKARLVDGLEGVAAERTPSDRTYLETVISALKIGVFLLHNVHQPRPIVFQSRWTLSFLRGPMTRDQIAMLMKGVKESQAGGQKPATAAKPVAAIPLCRRCRADLIAGVAVCPACGEPIVKTPSREEDQQFRQRLQQAARTTSLPALPRNPPELPAELQPFTLPLKQPLPAGAELLYQPRVLGFAQVSFVDRRRGLEHRRPYRLLGEPPANGQALSWMTAEVLEERRLDGPPEANAGCGTGAGDGEQRQEIEDVTEGL